MLLRIFLQTEDGGLFFFEIKPTGHILRFYRMYNIFFTSPVCQLEKPCSVYHLIYAEGVFELLKKFGAACVGGRCVKREASILQSNS